MLNVSATQELAREVTDLQITIRDHEIESMKFQMANIKSHIEELDELKSSHIKMCRDIELLKSHLSDSQLVSGDNTRDHKK